MYSLVRQLPNMNKERLGLNPQKSLAGKWIELEIIMLTEMSKAQKDKYTYFCSYGGI
jgi:hypothetical protein